MPHPERPPANPATYATALEVGSALLHEGSAHAESCWPEECCGLLLGRVGGGEAQVVRLERAENVAPQSLRRSRFEMQPETVAREIQRASLEGLRVVGFYHSHPSGPAVPSARDRAEAWSDTSYLIFSMRDGRVTEARSWRRAQGSERFHEEELISRSLEVHR